MGGYPHRSPCPSSARFPGDLFELRRAGARIRHPGRKAFSLRSVVGDRGHFGLRHASSGLSPLRRHCRTSSLGRRQAAPDAGLCRVLGLLDGITAIGVDEVQFQKGHRYLTVVYQINAECRRLLWVGQDRTTKTLLRFFKMMGRERTAAIRFICSDMWQPYLKVIAKKAGQAIHILDRFHIVAKLNKALDEIRASEAKQLARHGYEAMPKQSFQLFWEYTSPYWAGRFLDGWVGRAMRSRLEPIKAVARSIRNHRELILNWFKAKKEFNSGIVEGLNYKNKLTIRKAYGYRELKVAEIAIYHALAKLPEPELTHRCC